MRIILVAALSALLLTGCVPQGPGPVATPAPTSTPVFASDEEALAAAEAAYAAYSSMADLVFSEGGQGAERLADVATGDLLEAEMTGYANSVELGYRSTGVTTFEDVSLQQYESDGSYLAVYLCEDVSQIDVLGPDGQSVVSADRPPRTRYVVTFDEVDGQLLVSSKDLWGDGPC